MKEKTKTEKTVSFSLDIHNILFRYLILKDKN